MKRQVYLLVSFTLLLTGCSPDGPHLSVLRGNFSFERGQFQDAIVHYLEALEADRQGEFEGHVLFNLGTVYHSVAENEAALEAWDLSVAGDASADVLYPLHHNRGILYYRQGRYDDAYEQFRRALMLRPSAIGSKINLELALQRVLAQESAPTTRTGGGEATEPSDEAQRVLEYMRRKETGRWEATEAQETREVERYW